MNAWTIWGRQKNTDELARNDSFDSAEVAEEMASELFHQYRWCQVIVRDKDGVEVKRFERMTGNGNTAKRKS
jgi:hypothetical protein